MASANPGKVEEIASILGRLGIRIVPASQIAIEAVEETGRSYIENALVKARHAAVVARRPTIADDSGLEVDALGGVPGVFSARYAGPQADDRMNVEKLLRAMVDVPEGERGARFRCAMVYLRGASDDAPLIAEGVWEGSILTAPRGSGGFGYDPVFYVPGERCSVAELVVDVKNRLSHRAQALRGLCAQLSRSEPGLLGHEPCG